MKFFEPKPSQVSQEAAPDRLAMVDTLTRVHESGRRIGLGEAARIVDLAAENWAGKIDGFVLKLVADQIRTAMSVPEKPIPPKENT